MRSRLPHRRRSVTIATTSAVICRSLEVSIGYDGNGSAAEIFAHGAKAGSDAAAMLSDACIVISIALQHGATPAEILHSLTSVPRWSEDGNADAPASVIGELASILAHHATAEMALALMEAAQ